MCRAFLAMLFLALTSVTFVVGCDADTKASVNKALGRYRAYDGAADGAKQIADATATAKATNMTKMQTAARGGCPF